MATAKKAAPTKKTTKPAAAKSTPAKKVSAAPKKSTTTAKKAGASTPKKPATKEVVTEQPETTRRVRHPKVVVGFVDFLREQSVVGLAVGLVIGTQVKALADQLIASFINPLIGLVLPGRGALDQKVFALHLNHKTADFAWGSFVATLLSFITTAAVVYFVFKALKLDKLTKKKDAK